MLNLVYDSMFLLRELCSTVTLNFLFNVTVISYLLLRDVLSGLWVAEEFLFLPPDGVHVSLRLFLVF